jgi:urease accessory protein
VRMLVLTQRQTANTQIAPKIEPSACLTLALNASDRQRSRHRWFTQEGLEVQLQLPRGTVLQEGDLLGSDPPGTWVRVVAKPESVLSVSSPYPLDLVRAAYHLGNRHVPLEIGPNYLRLSPDPVLAELLVHLGLEVTLAEIAFFPEPGAYHGHGH